MGFSCIWLIKCSKRLGIILGLAIILSGCGNLTGTALPTLIPAEQLPTVIALTLSAGQASLPEAAPGAILTPLQVTATKAPTSTRTRYPTRTPTAQPPGTLAPPSTVTVTATALPSETPTASLTPPPVIPNAVIRFNKPAPLSRVISPIQVDAFVRTPADGVFRLELLGEDGRVITRQVLSAPQHILNLTTELEFGISATAEAGRLQIATYDQYGRIINLNSVDVVLLSIGAADLPYSIDTLERVMIEAPLRNAEIKGNVVTVYGRARPSQEKPYLIELINSNGGVVGSRQVLVTPQPGEGYGTFLVDVPYNVSQPTQVRLTISVKGVFIPGPAYVISREITVGP